MKRRTDNKVNGEDFKAVLKNVAHLYFKGELQKELRNQTLKAIEDAEKEPDCDEILKKIRDGVLEIIDCRYEVKSLTLQEVQTAYASLGVDRTNLEEKTVTPQAR